jgi:hypothetical protein
MKEQIDKTKKEMSLTLDLPALIPTVLNCPFRLSELLFFHRRILYKNSVRTLSVVVKSL